MSGARDQPTRARLAARAVERTALTVTTLGFGAAEIAGRRGGLSEADAARTIRSAWDVGVRYFDTAPHYGLGVSERRLGLVLRDYPRSDYVVSTKVGCVLVPNEVRRGRDVVYDVPDDLRREWDFSNRGVVRSLEQSLARLGLDAVDVLFVHDPFDHADQAIAEAIPTLCELRDQGVIGAVGIGIGVVDILTRAVRETDLDVIMLPGRWTLMDRSAAALVDECARRGRSIFAAAPFNSGLLAQQIPTEHATFDYRPAAAGEVARARELAAVCSAYGTTLPAAALQFPLRSGVVSSVVTGFRTPSHVTAAADALAPKIGDATWAALDAVAGDRGGSSSPG